MKDRTHIVVLMLAAALVCGCRPSAPQSSDAIVVMASPQVRNDLKITDVTFDYNEQIFGKAEATEVAEHPLGAPDHKPDGVAPQHVTFTFGTGKGFWKETQIAVYPVAGFPRVYAVNPESVRDIEKEIEGLRKVLRDKDFRVDGQFPYLPFVDASPSFQPRVRHFSFRSGSGILFVTHWSTEDGPDQ